MEFVIKMRNLIIGWLYRQILKRIYFLFDAEKVHDRMVKLGASLGHHKMTQAITSTLFNYQHPSLEQDILGIKFQNPIGLAAGFDKNVKLTQILPSVGFGFEEVGSISGEPCSGNPKPRLWRLPKSRALVVYYGLMNDGAKVLAERLNKLKFKIPIGVSLVKANSLETVKPELGIADYFKAYKKFYDLETGDYYTINLSCPNTFGGEPFTEPSKLDLLLAKINSLPKTKPIFLKMAPDISYEVLDDTIRIARKFQIDGFISTNLTKDRAKLKIKDKKLPEQGGISGKAVEYLANEQIRYIFHQTQGEFVIIGCGGVFSAEDAYQKIKLGASLIQMITGMVFRGPQVISEINQGLVRLLKQDGFRNISEAVGISHKE